MGPNLVLAKVGLAKVGHSRGRVGNGHRSDSEFINDGDVTRTGCSSSPS